MMMTKEKHKINRKKFFLVLSIRQHSELFKKKKSVEAEKTGKKTRQQVRYSKLLNLPVKQSKSKP